MPLDAEIDRWTARIAEISAGLPPVAPDDVVARRANARVLSDRLAAEFARPVHPGVAITDRTVAVAGGLAVRIYRPAAAGDAALATQLFLHGGGFVEGTVRELVNDSLLSERSVRAGIQIVSLDYRLAPEHPYPAAQLDAIETLRLLWEDHEGFGVDRRRLGVGGNSAGGGLAAGAVLRMRDARRAGWFEPAIVHQSLEVPAVSVPAPWTDDAAQHRAAWDAVGGGPCEEEKALGAIVGHYVTDPTVVDAYLSPVEATDLGDLPPTFVATAEFDALRAAGERYARRLVAAGVPTTLHRGRGHLHGTPALTARFAAAALWQDRVVDALRAAYHPRHRGPSHAHGPVHRSAASARAEAEKATRDR